MEFSEVVETRRSVKSYQSGTPISDAELKAIFEDVVLSPSSFNLQHWTFIVMRDPEFRAKVQEAAWGQKQISESSAAILVAGKLDAHLDADRIYDDAPEQVRKNMVPMIHDFYEGKERLQRDEAIRSGSLAAMSLMYAARARGYYTGPMIGFDPEAVSKLVNLPENYTPVMMVVIGKQKDEPRPRDYRRPIEEVVRLETFDAGGLKG